MAKKRTVNIELDLIDENSSTGLKNKWNDAMAFYIAEKVKELPEETRREVCEAVIKQIDSLSWE